jgi:hypothetical protein
MESQRSCCMMVFLTCFFLFSIYLFIVMSYLLLSYYCCTGGMLWYLQKLLQRIIVEFTPPSFSFLVPEVSAGLPVCSRLGNEACPLHRPPCNLGRLQDIGVNGFCTSLQALVSGSFFLFLDIWVNFLILLRKMLSKRTQQKQQPNDST